MLKMETLYCLVYIQEAIAQSDGQFKKNDQLIDLMAVDETNTAILIHAHVIPKIKNKDSSTLFTTVLQQLISIDQAFVKAF